MTDAIRARAKAPAVHELEQHLPSAGPQTVLTLHAELGDVRRFRDAKEVAAYIGLTPRVRNSADTRHHGPVTKRGNQEVLSRSGKGYGPVEGRRRFLWQADFVFYHERLSPRLGSVLVSE